MFLSIPEASHFPYLLPGAVSVLAPLGQCLPVKVSEEEKPHAGAHLPASSISDEAPTS